MAPAWPAENRCARLFDHKYRGSEENADGEFMRSLQQDIVSRMRDERVNAERYQFSGGGFDDDVIVDINSHQFRGFPMYLSMDGDPQYDSQSTTLPYLDGILHRECIPMVIEWSKYRSYSVTFSPIPTQFDVRPIRQRRYVQKKHVRPEGPCNDGCLEAMASLPERFIVENVIPNGGPSNSFTIPIDNWLSDGTIACGNAEELTLDKDAVVRLARILQEKQIYVALSLQDPTMEASPLYREWSECLHAIEQAGNPFVDAS